MISFHTWGWFSYCPVQLLATIHMQSFKEKKQNPLLLCYFLSRWDHASRTHALLHKRKRAIFQMGVQDFPHLLEKCIGCYRWCRHTGFPSRFFQTSWSSHWISCQARQTMSPLDFPAASSESSGSRCDHGYCYIYTKQQLNSVDELRPVTVCPELTAVTVSRIPPRPISISAGFLNVINL